MSIATARVSHRRAAPSTRGCASPTCSPAKRIRKPFFVADRFGFDGGRLVEVRGEFTLRGREPPLTLRALRFGCRTHAALQREVCGGDFEAEFARSEFGADLGLPFVADRVRLLIQVEARRDN